MVLRCMKGCFILFQHSSEKIIYRCLGKVQLLFVFLPLLVCGEAGVAPFGMPSRIFSTAKNPSHHLQQRRMSKMLFSNRFF